MRKSGIAQKQRPFIDITDTEWDLIGQRIGVPARQVDIARAYVRGYRTSASFIPRPKSLIPNP